MLCVTLSFTTHKLIIIFFIMKIKNIFLKKYKLNLRFQPNSICNSVGWFDSDWVLKITKPNLTRRLICEFNWNFPQTQLVLTSNLNHTKPKQKKFNIPQIFHYNYTYIFKYAKTLHFHLQAWWNNISEFWFGKKNF